MHEGNEHIQDNTHAYKQGIVYSQYFSPFDNIKKGTKRIRERKLPLSISIGEYKKNIYRDCSPIKKPYRK